MRRNNSTCVCYGDDPVEREDLIVREGKGRLERNVLEGVSGGGI